jgi:hypothetical protein
MPPYSLYSVQFFGSFDPSSCFQCFALLTRQIWGGSGGRSCLGFPVRGSFVPVFKIASKKDVAAQVLGDDPLQAHALGCCCSVLGTLADPIPGPLAAPWHPPHPRQ